MIRQFTIALFFALVFANCDFKISKKGIDKPGEVQFQFSRGKKQISLCFQLDLPKNQNEYLLRLDYLPFQCLDAKNDVKMNWNAQKSKYQAEVEVRRQCKKRTLHQNQEEPYRLIYQFRQGYDKGGILAYKQLVHKYLPTLVAIFFISLVAQRFIFASFNKEKIKSN